MSRSQSKQLTVRSNVPTPQGQAVASSLPPTPDEQPTSPIRKIEKNSVIHKKALAIVAMQIQGYSTDEIAKELRIKPNSVKQYIYMATRSGLLVNRKTGESLLSVPADRIEYELAHKAVRNLDEFLDSPDDEVRKEVTLKIFDGALKPKFETPKEAPVLPGMNVLAVKIDMPSAPQTTQVRTDQMGGVPFIDGETDEDR